MEDRDAQDFHYQSRVTAVEEQIEVVQTVTVERRTGREDWLQGLQAGRWLIRR